MRRTMILATVALLVCAVASPVGACVGKTLIIGVVDRPRDVMIADILSVFVAERTGTSVVVKKFDSSLMLHQAILGGTVDLSLAIPSTAWKEVMGKTAPLDPEELRTFFLSTFNQIWGVPVGVAPDDDRPAQDQFTPLLRRDTLVKFPALPKLLRKMEGKVQPAWLEQALAKGLPAQGERDRLARGLLKELKLI